MADVLIVEDDAPIRRMLRRTLEAEGHLARTAASGAHRVGLQPGTGLSGQPVSAVHGLELVGASFAVYLMPIAAVVCIGVLLSALFRNSAAAVVGTLMSCLMMQLIGILPGLGGLKPVPADDTVRGLAGFLQNAGRLAADRPRRLGMRALRAAGAGGRLPDVPAAGCRLGRLSKLVDAATTPR